MSNETRNIAGRFIKEVINEGNMQSVDALVAPEYVYHGPNGEDAHGPEGLKRIVGELRKGFPDLKVHPHKLIAEGDYITLRYTLEGTHQDTFYGIPATRRRVNVQGMVMSRIENGRVMEDWEMYDVPLFMRQLGVEA